MKTITRVLSLTLFTGVLFSCAPKVITNVLKNYPPLPENEEVVIYERDNGDPVPANAETVGNIAVVDNGLSVRGSYERVLGLATDETRRNGGNGLLITDHLEPSFWGSSIHQIGGLMLRVDHADTAFVSSRDAYLSMKEENERKRIHIPTHTFMLNSGYGLLSANTNELSGEEKQFVDQLHQGLTWDFQYYYHHTGLPFGFGLIFSQFYSSPFKELVFNEIKNNLRLDYVAPSFALRHAFAPKWVSSANYGLGYLGVMQKLSNPANPSEYGTITGSTLGIHFGFGIEYQISKHMGVGASLMGIVGSLSSVELSNLTVDPSTPEINSENRLNASRFNATIGLRYYLH